MELDAEELRERFERLKVHSSKKGACYSTNQVLLPSLPLLICNNIFMIIISL